MLLPARIIIGQARQSVNQFEGKEKAGRGLLIWNPVERHSRISNKGDGCPFLPQIPLYYFAGTNSSLICMPIPSANLRSVRKEGFALPFSSLLISA